MDWIDYWLIYTGCHKKIYRHQKYILFLMCIHFWGHPIYIYIYIYIYRWWWWWWWWWWLLHLHRWLLSLDPPASSMLMPTLITFQMNSQINFQTSSNSSFAKLVAEMMDKWSDDCRCYLIQFLEKIFVYQHGLFQVR